MYERIINMQYGYHELLHLLDKYILLLHDAKYFFISAYVCAHILLHVTSAQFVLIIVGTSCYVCTSAVEFVFSES